METVHRQWLVPGNSNLPIWLAGIALAAIVWFFTYVHLQDIADFVLLLTGYDRSTHLGEALHFFFFDAPKVLLLLIGIVFFMGIIQTLFSAERTRALLGGKREGLGNALAALLGIFTPFCSCSAIPLFIGFLATGIPLGITLSFLIAAPMVNEIALVLLFALLGWQVAALYLGLGLSIAIIAGIVIGKLRMERYLQDWVREVQDGTPASVSNGPLLWEQRFQAGWSHVKDIVGNVWIYILAGIAVGAGIHGFVPQDFMARFMGEDVWWSVPAAVVLGVPMYTNAAGVVPIVEALIDKGAAPGTTLAFMMSVIALSLPEMLILHKVLKLPLILTFIGVVASGILVVGYLFNLIL